MRVLWLLVPLSLALAAAGPARAQACLGLPSFDRAVHLGGSGEFPDSATAYALAVTGGTPGGLFSSLGAGTVRFTGLAARSTLAFLELGLQRALGPAQLCPIAGGYLGIGPDDPAAGLEVTSRAAAAGLALGIPFGTPTLRFLPNVALRYQYTSQKVDEADVGSLTDGSGQAVLDLGLGLLLHDRLGVQPLLHLPLGGDGGPASLGVLLSASLGLHPR